MLGQNILTGDTVRTRLSSHAYSPTCSGLELYPPTGSSLLRKVENLSVLWEQAQGEMADHIRPFDR